MGQGSTLQSAPALAAAFAFLLVRQRAAVGRGPYEDPVRAVRPRRSTKVYLQSILAELERRRAGNTTGTGRVLNAVADRLQGVTDVIRGVGLLASTGRQVLLGRLIGRPAPAAFAHHALIMKSPTQKLSKSDGDTGVRDLRAAGWTRQRVIDACRMIGPATEDTLP